MTGKNSASLCHRAIAFLAHKPLVRKLERNRGFLLRSPVVCHQLTRSGEALQNPQSRC